MSAYPGSFTRGHARGERLLAQRKADPGDDRVPILGLAFGILQKNAAHVAAPPMGEIAAAVEYLAVAHAGDREELPGHSGVFERAGSQQKVPLEVGPRAAPLFVGQRV